MSRLQEKKDRLKAKLAASKLRLPSPTNEIKTRSVDCWDIPFLLSVAGRERNTLRRTEALYNLAAYLEAAFNNKTPRRWKEAIETGRKFDWMKDKSFAWGDTAQRHRTISQLAWTIYEGACLPAIFAFLKSKVQDEIILAMHLCYQLMYFTDLWHLIILKEPQILAIARDGLSGSIPLRLASLSVLHQIVTRQVGHQFLHGMEIVRVVIKSLSPITDYGPRKGIRMLKSSLYNHLKRCDFPEKDLEPFKHEIDTDVIHNLKANEEQKFRDFQHPPPPPLLSADQYKADALSLWFIYLIALHPSPSFSYMAMEVADWIIAVILSVTDNYTHSSSSFHRSKENHAPPNTLLESHMVLVWCVELFALCCRYCPDMQEYVLHEKDLPIAIDVLRIQIAPERQDPRLSSAIERLVQIFFRESQSPFSSTPYFADLYPPPQKTKEIRLCGLFGCGHERISTWLCTKCRLVGYCSKDCLTQDISFHHFPCCILSIDQENFTKSLDSLVKKEVK